MDNSIPTYRVYKLTFPNGMIYIGMTKRTVKARVYAGYRHNSKLNAAVKQFGVKNIIKDVLEDNLTLQEADAKEIKYISAFDSTNPDIGYNISRGGIKAWEGLRHSEESRKKMSISGKGKHSGIHNANFGKKRSFEENELNRKAHKRFMHPVYQMDLAGNIINTFESVSAAAHSVNTSTRNIRMCLTGKSATACKYKWKYKEGN